MTLQPTLALSIPLQTLIVIGVSVGMVVVALSFYKWRIAVKTAFIILLIEGALRKWVFASGQELIYFLKDAVLLGAYLRFFFAPERELRNWRLKAPFGLVLLLCGCVSFSALNPNIGSPILAIYGLKTYLYYLPLAFMVPFLWRSEEQMVRELTRYALLAIPICILGLAQSRAGLDSTLNVFATRSADDLATGFGFGDVARITGTFSYLSGHTTFVIFFAALHIALLMMDVKKIYWWLLLLDLPLLLGNAYMGGSRASIFSMAIVVAGFIGSSFFATISRRKNVIVILSTGCAIAVIGAAIFFAESKANWMGRYLGSDTVADRVYAMPIWTVTAALEDGGVLGYGVGTTHPAVSALRTALRIPLPHERPIAYDMEVAQVLVELGLVGTMAWYILRMMMIWQSFDSFRRSPPGTMRSLLLAATLVQLPHFYLSVVLNHTANFLVFACYGLALIPQLQRIRQRDPREVPGSRLASLRTPGQAGRRN